MIVQGTVSLCGPDTFLSASLLRTIHIHHLAAVIGIDASSSTDSISTPLLVIGGSPESQNIPLKHLAPLVDFLYLDNPARPYDSSYHEQ